MSHFATLAPSDPPPVLPDSALIIVTLALIGIVLALAIRLRRWRQGRRRGAFAAELHAARRALTAIRGDGDARADLERRLEQLEREILRDPERITRADYFDRLSRLRLELEQRADQS